MNTRVLRAVTALALWFGASLFALAQTKRALLIGIDTYSPQEPGAKPLPAIADTMPHRPDSRFGGAVSWHNLEGPERDVESMAALLPSFGFTEIHELLGQQATRGEILAELDKYLIEEPRSGDTVLFYFAGHGSQRLNSKSNKPDHLDETIVPADAYKGVFDIRDKELARKFNQALDKKVQLIAIFDSCHSGTMARGTGIAVSRWLPFDDRDAADGGDFGSGAKPQPDPPAKRGAIIISAALSTQTADEITDHSGQVHGVFTSAFIHALLSSTPAWTTLDLVNSADAMLKADGWAQQPTVEGPNDRPLFGGFSINSIHASIREVEPPDHVVLNVGSAMGLGPDSEFESLAHDGIKLTIVQVTGAASSLATIAKGGLANVHAGDLFQITRLAVPSEAKITVFVPGAPSDDEWNKIAQQIARIRAADGWSLVSDPVVDPPTNLVYWSPAGWRLTSPQGEACALGKVLTSDAISSQIRSQSKVYTDPRHEAKVFISVPPTQAMIEALSQQTGIRTGAIEISDSLVASQYLLAGHLLVGNVSEGAEYSLILRSVFQELDPKSFVRSQVKNHTIICSTDSEMPLRTDWVGFGGNADDARSPVGGIENAALILGRHRAWLTLGAHNGTATWPYRLAITETNSDQQLDRDAALTLGTEYDVSLIADPQELASHAVRPQYVYLFGLQCDGEGNLLYPPKDQSGGAPLPLLAADGKSNHYSPKYTLLSHVQVSTPVGRDTFILLETPERIPDLSAFSYSGVLTRARSSGNSSELEELVRGIGGQTRGIGSVSATWSIQRVAVKSH